MYSGKPEDIGNNRDGIDLKADFFGLHMRFFIEQLYRVMKPGTVVAIHLQQLLTWKVQHGYMGRRDLRGAVVDLFSAGGFNWTGEITIAKNPQRIAQQLELHSLLFITGKRNARRLAPAVNDYIALFVKPGDGEPVRAIYDREQNPGGWVTTDEWIRDAHGVWTDINEIDVLEGWQGARGQDDEKHVCPLQLEVIRRLVRLYSNPGDLVLDPFMGIGSTAWVALGAPSPHSKLSVGAPRNAVGFELKESYHALAERNVRVALELAESQANIGTLFGWADEQEAARVGS